MAFDTGKFKDICTGLSMVAVPIILGIATHLVSLSLKESDSEIRKLELAIDILRNKPDSENADTAIRRWAAETIGFDEKSTLEISKQTLPISSGFPVNPFLKASSFEGVYGFGPGFGFGSVNPLINNGFSSKDYGLIQISDLLKRDPPIVCDDLNTGAKRSNLKNHIKEAILEEDQLYRHYETLIEITWLSCKNDNLFN